MVGSLVLALAWLGLVVLVGAIALPIVARLFARPARGAAFAIPLGLAALTMGTFWLGRIDLGLAPLVSVALLGLAAFVLGRGDDELPTRAYAEAAAVFTAGFGLVLVIQTVAGAITASGETYWNFGLVQSLLRTGRLPPTDPWFAGEPVRYYYGGHLLVATLAELLDTPGRYAFALGKAVVFGALVTAAYGLSGAIAAARDRPARPAGLLGAFFVGLASNLHPPIWGLLSVLPETLADPLGSVVPVTVTPGASLEAFSLLDAAHFSFTNTDFPAYTLYLTGIHPHWASPPFLLLLAGVLFAYAHTPAGARRRRLALLGLATPVVGLVALVNTWSLPAAGGLVGLAVALAPTHPLTLVGIPTPRAGRSPTTDWVGRLASGVVAGFAAVGLGLLWVAPYVLRGLAGDPGIGLLPPRSGPWFFVIGYGGFLLAFAAFLTVELGSADWSSRARRVAITVGAGLLVVAWLGDFAGLALVGPVLLGGLALHRRDRSDFLPVLLIAGAGLALLVELAYVAESAEIGRYNTVYKVYMQTWVLWSPAAGVAVARVAGHWSPGRAARSWRPAFAVLLVAALSLYGVAGVSGHVSYAVSEDGRPTLDGLAHLESDHPDYAAAIGWLADRNGQPTIVSAPVSERRLYQFNASPAASLTGIPTVVGWNHEADYRGDAVYRQRVAAVDRIYAGTRAERAATLRAYDVRFIWVGEGERERYRVIDYSREPGISVAFQRGNVTIYRIDRSALVGR